MWRLLLHFMAVAHCGLAVPVSAAEFYTVDTGSTVTIDEHGICQKVANASGNRIFVPTKTAAEWAAFRNNRPAGVTLEGCLTIAKIWSYNPASHNTMSPYGCAGHNGFSGAMGSHTGSGWYNSCSWGNGGCHYSMSGLSTIPSADGFEIIMQYQGGGSNNDSQSTYSMTLGWISLSMNRVTISFNGQSLPPPGTAYIVRLQVKSSGQYRMKAWTGATEPTAWGRTGSVAPGSATSTSMRLWAGANNGGSTWGYGQSALVNVISDFYDPTLSAAGIAFPPNP